jgi:CDP-6-deoxy-D-xylo-4-hexulose-3-dehydrase
VRPTKIQAVIGINQIAKIHDYVSRRIEIARKVAEAVKNTPLKIMGGVDFSNSKTTYGHLWVMISLAVDSGLETNLRIQEFFEQNGVETRPVITGNILHQPAMKNTQCFIRDVSLKNTDWVPEHCS